MLGTSSQASPDSGSEMPYRFNLTNVEALTLSVSKLWLMEEEWQLEDKETSRYLKWLVFGDFAMALGVRWADGSMASVLGALPVFAADRIRRAIEANTPSVWEEVCDLRVVEPLWQQTTERDRALVIALELAAFSPWGDPKTLKQDEGKRRDRLRFLSENLGGQLGVHELLELDEDLRTTIKRVQKRPRNWRRIGLIGVGGAAIGAATGGLAAPAIGGAIGGSMGLSGAAATNAGLALLGGGSLASGGLGMAGGTALITATAAFGGGAVAAGAGVTGQSKGYEPGGEAGAAAKNEGPHGPEGVADLLPPSAADAAVEGSKVIVLTTRVVLGERRDRAMAQRIRAGYEELSGAASARLTDLGGGDASDRHADQLTQIDHTLTRTVTSLSDCIDRWERRENSKRP